MSTVAVIFVIVVALLPAVMFAATLRRSGHRHAHYGPGDDGYRSHAEASRGDRR